MMIMMLIASFSVKQNYLNLLSHAINFSAHYLSDANLVTSISCLHNCLETVLLLTKCLSKVHTSSKHRHLPAAVDLVDTTKDTPQYWRNDSALLDKALQWTDIVCIAIDSGLSSKVFPRPHCRLQQPTLNDKFVGMETAGAQSNEEDFRVIAN